MGQSQDRFVTVPVHVFQKYWQARGSFYAMIKSGDAGPPGSAWARLARAIDPLVVTWGLLLPFCAAALGWALAHPGRLLMVDELSRGERCVCELAELVGSEMPTVSRHLSQLKNAGIVDDDKRGAQVFYRLVTPCVMNFFRCVASVREKSRERGAAA